MFAMTRNPWVIVWPWSQLPPRLWLTLVAFVCLMLGASDVALAATGVESGGLIDVLSVVDPLTQILLIWLLFRDGRTNQTRQDSPSAKTQSPTS